MRYTNLTPHGISVLGPEGITQIPKGSSYVRARPRGMEVLGYVEGCPVVRKDTAHVDEIPPPRENHVYIVSFVVAMELQRCGVNRSDVVFPGTRDADGVVRDPRTRQVQAVSKLYTLATA